MTREDIHKHYDDRIPDAERRLIAHGGYKEYAIAFAATAARNFTQRLHDVRTTICARRKKDMMSCAIFADDVAQMRHKAIEALELKRALQL